MKKNNTKGFRRFIRVLSLILLFVLLVVSLVGYSLLGWFKETFGVSIVEIIYTVKSPLAGADTDFVGDAVSTCLPSLYAAIIVFVLVLLVLSLGRRVSATMEIGAARPLRLDLFSLFLAVVLLYSGVTSVMTLRDADEALGVFGFISSRLSKTTIYDNYYVAPEIDQIKGGEDVNLLYIYMESMESTYASVADGGRQAVNYIPNLTRLAEENVSFSNTEKLGGFHCNVGAGWTVAAMFSCQSGIPFSFPIKINENFENREAFATGTVMLGDILAEKGYYQEFLCGSKATFAGRRALFEQHGNYNIYDVYTAIDDCYLTEEEKVWWGLEDRLLYEIAKDELNRISSQDQPFNFTMLTVDTHHVGGWVCELCGDEYPVQVANVIKCADDQLKNFLDWCSEQPWYENTVIVIQGDHPRMDTHLVEDVSYYDRTVYNCFLNTGYDPKSLPLKNREFISCDMFPTVLAAMGYEIPGDRLGLGTNLFSGRPTLTEELGFDYLNEELGKTSYFYVEHFS